MKIFINQFYQAFTIVSLILKDRLYNKKWIKKQMIQQKPSNGLSPKQKSAVMETGQPHYGTYTQQQQQIYNSMLQNWKVAQRNSLSKVYENEAQILKQMDKSKSPCVYAYTPQGRQSDTPIQRTFTQAKDSVFNKYTEQIVYYLKSKFIVEQIVQQLEQKKLVDLTDYKVIEFMHLATFRAWVDINFAVAGFAGLGILEKQLQQSKSSIDRTKIQTDFNKESLKILALPMQKLAQKVEKIFSFYHKSLSFRQGTFKYRLKSFYNFIFHNSQKSTRDKILFGVEGVDFTRQQQIKYTQQNIIQQMRKRLLQNSGKTSLKMRGYLQAYGKIMRIQMHKLQSFDAFETIKNTIIKQQQVKKSLKPTLL